MTEPELIKILSMCLESGHKPTTVLSCIGQPDFPKVLLKTAGMDVTYEIVKSIYYGLTVEHRELCELERAIVTEVKSWDKTVTQERLKHLRSCFLDSDLRSDGMI